ncbi:galacturonosyltransferase 15 isoform X2 [Tasmannia lanceolata]|uniref:galacturonosyltransferase 15 isoform X2 n=1 Tax=Tasmannia lanceolata TaxID=3420 RepID=UPI0040628605
MHIYVPSGARKVTISSEGGCFWEVMKVRGSSRRFSYRSVLPTVLIAGILLPFLFIRAAFLALEGASKCSSDTNCIGWKFGPLFFNGRDTSLLLKMERKVQWAKLQGSIYRHLASIGIPKSMDCLCLRLAEEYSVNSLARSSLPPPEFISRLADTSYNHLAVLTDNVLAAAVVVSSAVRNSGQPEKMVFHIVTDKKMYAPMHAWFALHSVAPAVVEVKGLHQYEWPIHVNIGVMEMMEIHRAIQDHFYRDGVSGNLEGDGLFGKLEALRPNYVSIMNYLRIYLPELFPELDKIVFLDDDIIVQHDLSPLWAIHLDGKVMGAVSPSQGEGERSYCFGRKFSDYLNFSSPIVSMSELAPDRCAWLYGMNVFNLEAWRRTNITQTYHRWLKLNLDSGFTLWRMGALSPSLIAFNGQVHPIDPSWHISGLGHQLPDVDEKTLEAAAVIHFSGPAKPWLEIGFPELRSLWNTHVNFSNEFIRSCSIME